MRNPVLLRWRCVRWRNPVSFSNVGSLLRGQALPNMGHQVFRLGFSKDLPDPQVNHSLMEQLSDDLIWVNVRLFGVDQPLRVQP